MNQVKLCKPNGDQRQFTKEWEVGDHVSSGEDFINGLYVTQNSKET